MGQCCPRESSDGQNSSNNIPLADFPPPSIRLLDLYLSVRFNLIDVYVRPPPHSAPLPTPSRYEFQYRKLNSTTWTKVPNDQLERPDGVAGRFYTIAKLEPTTDYEVYARVISDTDNTVLGETPVNSVTTGTGMTFIKGYVALFDFTKRVEHEVSSKVGDVLQEDPDLINSPDLPAGRVFRENSSADYICVRNSRTNQVGLFPVVCVERRAALDRPSLIQDQECYYDINRRKAEVWMMRPNVEPGRFIVRPSHSSTFLALSVRFGITLDGVPQVEHFKIYTLHDGYGCYVNVPTRTFEDITQLLSYYKHHSISMARQISLNQPFPRNPQPPAKLHEIGIPAAKIAFQQKLGSGNFGEVYKARLNSLDVAVKKLLPAHSVANGDDLLREAKEMAAYFHDNLVKLIGVCIDAEPYLIVSEYMNRGSLLKWLADDNAVVEIQLQIAVFILCQIACGMAYLEDKQVVHRDLRAANVLVHDENDQLEIKITDFGLMRKIRENEEIYRSGPFTLVPIRWTAPEAYLKSEFSVKSDVWSFGIVCYEVVSLGAMPYKGKNNEEVSLFVKGGGRLTIDDCRNNRRNITLPRHRPVEELCPDSLFAEFSKCWREDPKDRPTFAALNNLLENFESGTNYR